MYTGHYHIRIIKKSDHPYRANEEAHISRAGSDSPADPLNRSPGSTRRLDTCRAAPRQDIVPTCAATANVPFYLELFITVSYICVSGLSSPLPHNSSVIKLSPRLS